ncbi:unnamed protein product [Pieris brassicae]|uniref:Uncharacterized protein n=1 Tax=Pieris brassicae TaxID=7116 RepID=A0A9P0TKV3_PIEBR|nr:unnamed protein product [Pieris brassicae]
MLDAEDTEGFFPFGYGTLLVRDSLDTVEEFVAEDTAVSYLETIRWFPFREGIQKIQWIRRISYLETIQWFPFREGIRGIQQVHRAWL